MTPTRQILAIFALTGLLCGVWTAALRVLPRPALAETNYEANRLRMENWMLGPPAPAALVGTSITGRIIPGYFDGTPLAGVANLGLDGASPDTGLQLVLMRQPVVPLVLLDVYLIAKRPGPNDQQLLDLASGIGLKVSSLVPLTRADARPSTVLYGWLKERKGGEGSADVRARVVTAAAVADEVAAMDPDWLPRVRERIRRLQGQGCRVVLTRLPAGRADPADPEAPNEADAIARELGVSLIDLFRLSRKAGIQVTYTDGLHLTPRSARAVSLLLVTALEERGWVPEGVRRDGPSSR